LSALQDAYKRKRIAPARASLRHETAWKQRR